MKICSLNFFLLNSRFVLCLFRLISSSVSHEMKWNSIESCSLLSSLIPLPIPFTKILLLRSLSLKKNWSCAAKKVLSIPALCVCICVCGDSEIMPRGILRRKRRWNERRMNGRQQQRRVSRREIFLLTTLFYEFVTL